jgi:hypothetical protein
MKKQTKSVFAAALALVLCVGIGCGKKQAAVTEPDGETPAPVTQSESLSAANLQGANEVIASLNRKDYESTVGGIVRLKQTSQTQAQQEQLFILIDEVRMRLLEEAPNDPKAAEALHMLRRITGGR